jgi:hypothetical protein
VKCFIEFARESLHLNFPLFTSFLYHESWKNQELKRWDQITLDQICHRKFFVLCLIFLHSKNIAEKKIVTLEIVHKLSTISKNLPYPNLISPKFDFLFHMTTPFRRSFLLCSKCRWGMKLRLNSAKHFVKSILVTSSKFKTNS